MNASSSYLYIEALHTVCSQSEPAVVENRLWHCLRYLPTPSDYCPSLSHPIDTPLAFFYPKHIAVYSIIESVHVDRYPRMLASMDYSTTYSK